MPGSLATLSGTLFEAAELCCIRRVRARSSHRMRGKEIAAPLGFAGFTPTLLARETCCRREAEKSLPPQKLQSSCYALLSKPGEDAHQKYATPAMHFSPGRTICRASSIFSFLRDPEGRRRAVVFCLSLLHVISTCPTANEMYSWPTYSRFGPPRFFVHSHFVGIH